MYRRALVLAVAALAIALGGCSGSGSSNDRQSVDQPGNDSPPPDEDPPGDEPPSDSPPELSIDDMTAAETDGELTFTVHAAGSNLDEVAVDFATMDGSATAGSDYQAASGRLTFTADSPEQTVTVRILDDAEPEGEESFTLELTNPANAEIARTAGVATITDDEQLDVCGAPDIDPATDAGIFLWKDCSLGIWQLRAAGAGERTAFEGELDASDPFTTLSPVQTESDDVVAYPVPNEIAFALDVENDQDGFEFETTEDAGACLEMFLPAAGSVLVGPDRAPVTPPFDLGTLRACDSAPAPESYNIVVLFTDDQRFDTLQYMPHVSTRVVPRGVDFQNAYVPTPLCCPARASTYAGGFLSQNTGVLTNSGVNGGMQAFDDSVNLGTLLQQAGYQTQFIGKWLNDYIRFSPYIPPGWDDFAGRAEWSTIGDWCDFRYGVGSTGEGSEEGTEVRSNGQYHVDFERDRIIDFIENASPNQPFFVFWSTTPPHAPFFPDEADQDEFADFTYRDRGYGETDLSDKPNYVRNDPGLPGGDDQDVRNQLRSLLSVDRGLDAILDTVAAQGKLDETVFIVTSDNGYLWGEHGLWAKNKPYEESIRVPMVVVVPGIEPRTDDNLVYAVLDLGPTLYDIAGVTGDSDGESLLPLLENSDVAWRNELYFEKYSTARSMHGLWMGVRQDNWKYIEYANGEAELYDLAADPFELENRANDPAYNEVRIRLADRMADQLGLSIKPVFEDMNGRVGEDYLLALEAWGGEPPLEWKVESGELPPGLSLDPVTGEISGKPLTAGSWTFHVRVTANELASQTQRPMTWITGELVIEIR